MTVEGGNPMVSDVLVATLNGLMETVRPLIEEMLPPGVELEARPVTDGTRVYEIALKATVATFRVPKLSISRDWICDVPPLRGLHLELTVPADQPTLLATLDLFTGLLKVTLYPVKFGVSLPEGIESHLSAIASRQEWRPGLTLQTELGLRVSTKALELVPAMIYSVRTPIVYREYTVCTLQVPSLPIPQRLEISI